MRKFILSAVLSVLSMCFAFKTSAGNEFNPDKYIDGPFELSGRLSSNTICDIVQTADGYLYFSTLEGIDRYDGYELRHIKFPDECKGFDCSAVLCEDDFGRIWAASYNGIAVYSPQTGQVSLFSKGSVSNMLKVRNGNIFVSAQYGGYFKIDPATMKCDTLKYEYHNASAHFGSGLCYDGRDSLYYINGVGALYRSGIDDSEMELIAPYDKSPFSMLNISSIVYIDGRIVGGLPSKTIIYDLKTGETSFRTWSYIRDLVCTDSFFFLATEEGLKVLDGDLNELYSYGIVSCLCKDSSGGILFGTYSSGVGRLQPNYFDVRTYLRNEPGHDVVVKDVAIENDDRIWVATKEDGLVQLNPKTGSVKRIPLPFKSDLLALGFVSDRLMVGVHSAILPLLSVSLKDNSVKTIDYVPLRAFSFLDLGDGHFLMGSAGRISHVDMNRKESWRLEKVRATVPAVFKYDGAVWAASSFNGLWSVRDSVWKHYNDSLGVSMLIQDGIPGKDAIYLATMNYGLQCLKPDGEVRNVENFSDVHCARINSLAQDRDGILWMTTSKGMASYDPATERTAFYFEKEFPLEQGNTFSKIRCSPDNHIYVGTSDGLLSFDPSKLKGVHPLGGEIMFTSMSILRTLGDGNTPSFEEGKAVNSFRTISLKAAENSFTIGVSDMNYSQPRTTSMVYKLEGYTDTWTCAKDGKITINSLRPGKYRLVVRSMDRYGNLLDTERVLDMLIQMPMALSVPAIILYVLLFSALVAAIVIFFKRKAVKDARESAMIEAQKRDADNQKKLYTAKIEFLLGIAHDIRTPLSLVRGPIETLRNKLKGIKDPAILEDLEIIGRNSEALASMLDELLDFKKLENSGYKISLANEDIVKIVDNCCKRFQVAARSQKRTLRVNLPHSQIMAAVDRNVLDKIVANLLSNAIKYSRSDIVLKLEKSAEEFSLTVENDGAVVPLEERERIFLPFERYLESGSGVSGTGIGLFISRNFAELHGGHLVMDDDLSVNRFILDIPISYIATNSDISVIPQFNHENRNMCVLLVEDNEELRNFIARQFDGKFTVLQAMDGDKALAILENMDGLPDLIISDVMMPGLDGYQLCKRVKSDDRMSMIPVMLLTARADVESRVMGWEFGADAYVSKPFSAVELVAQAAGMIENSRRLKERFLHSEGAERDKLSSASPHTIFLRAADEFISKNIEKEDISVEDLAVACCMSESSLFKKMKGLIGVGPGEYILLFRLKKAAELLKSSKASIAEISVAVGFRSHSTFSTAFKKQFGMSPKEFRDK